MNRGRKCGGFKFKENRVGFYGVSVLVLGDISDNAARRNCGGKVGSKQPLEFMYRMIPSN